MGTMSLQRELAGIRPAEDGHDLAECCTIVDAICEQHALARRARRVAARQQETLDRISALEGRVAQQETALGVVAMMATGGGRHG